MKHRTNYRLTKEGHYIQVQNGASSACLSVKERKITLTAIGNYEAEMIFLELFKKWDSRFLAVNFSQERYGWTSPVKQRKLI